MSIFNQKGLWKAANPTGAIADFREVYRNAGPNRWRTILLALATTGIVFSLIVWEEYRIEPRAPKIIYINSWRADRSNAEIRASNIANQHLKEALAAEETKHADEVKEVYKAIGRASFLDVDKMERDAKADEAADKAKKAASDAKILAQMAKQAETSAPDK